MDDELREMTRQRMNLDSMSRLLRVPKHRIVLRLAQLGLEIPGKVRIDTVRFFELWNDESYTMKAISRAFRVRDGVIARASRRYGMPVRRRQILDVIDGNPVGEKEEEASVNSLRLAPSVEREAAKVRSGWSESEKYNRRVQRVQPLTYDRVGIGVA